MMFSPPSIVATESWLATASCAVRRDLGDDLIGGAVVVAGAVGADAGVVDDDLRAFLGHEVGDAAADAAAGAGDDGDLAF